MLFCIKRNIVVLTHESHTKKEKSIAIFGFRSIMTVDILPVLITIGKQLLYASECSSLFTGTSCITGASLRTRWICDGRPGPTRHYAGALQGLRRRPTMSLVRLIQILSFHPILARALHVIHDHVVFGCK